MPLKHGKGDSLLALGLWSGVLYRGSRRFESCQYLAILRPDPQHAILAASDDHFSVTGDPHGIHEVATATEHADIAAIICSLDMNVLVTAGSYDIDTVRHVLDAGHFLAKSGDRPLLVTGLDGPDFDHVVRTTSHEGAAIGTPADTQHMVSVSFEGPHECPIGDLEDLGKPVGTTTCDVLAIARKLDGKDRVAVGFF